MNADEVRALADATLEGSLPFPEIVGKLIANGVEYYHVDYAMASFTFYSATGAAVCAPLQFEGLPPIAREFDAAALKAAILDSQQHGQKFRVFCRRAVEAGVQGYFAFLRGQRVTYLGRQGDQHVEWFPGPGQAMRNDRSDPLDRFVEAQASTYDRAMREIESGRKQSHWMWYVFPQLIGLGRSETSIRYAIRNLGEARDYLGHPVLGPRLVAATQAVLRSKSNPKDMFGTVDALKFSSCMTLFASVAEEGSVFAEALGQGVEADKATLAMLRSGEFG